MLIIYPSRSKHTHPQKTSTQAHSHSFFVTGRAALWLSTHPYSLARVTFMASSAVRVRWQSFQARIYLPGCISMHCGIFLRGRKAGRWGKAGYNYFDGRCLAPVLEVFPCLSTMSISRTAGQQPLQEGSVPFPAGAKQLF